MRLSDDHDGEQFIGPDIVGHPVGVVRTKTPNTALMAVPWHPAYGEVPALGG